MVEKNPTVPFDPKNLLSGRGNKYPPGAPRKPESRHGRKATSKGNPLTALGGSKNWEGRMATESTRRSKSRREKESVAHSRSVHNNEDILYKKRQEIEEFARLIKKRKHEIRELERIREHLEDSGLSRRNSRGDRYAMVKYKKAPSVGRRSRSRSRTPEPRKASSRKRRSRSRSLTPKEGETRKHHRDRYERLDSDWERNAPNKTKERKEGTMSAREAARKALNNIASSPFARRLQEARLLSRVKHGAFILYETNIDPVAHIEHYQQAMFMHNGNDHARNEDDILQEYGKVVAKQAKGLAKKADKPEPKTYRERKDYGQDKKEPYKEKHAPDP
ncbi:uncharacterized protein LOC131329886 [Rhododendron vialii]|uniref:uncharacterized protein LOC131329886 n=1 Tax=Rhododendron vialii TaxID=182163 RepID=UPI00265E19C5|nr:uncharacterized protein LOC131329886 [Rhododendron vialii]